MIAIDLDAIENAAQKEPMGQLYWTIHQLVRNSQDADAICRDYGIFAKANRAKDRLLLRNRFGSCMESGFLATVCGYEVPLVIGSLSLIGLWRCQIDRNDNKGVIPTVSTHVANDEGSVVRTAVLALLVESRKIGPFREKIKDLTAQDALELLGIATFFRCMAPEDSEIILRDTGFRDAFSPDDLEVLVLLDIKPGGNLIDVQSRYELRARLQDYRRNISIVRLGAISNSLGLKGFTH